MKKYSVTAASSTNRPLSRLSTATSFRPTSRLSTRTTATARLRSTHVQHIAALLRNLVQQVTGIGPEDDPDEFQDYVSGALDTVLNGSGPACDMLNVTKRIAGHREKARIYLQNDLADAFTTSFRRLNTLVGAEERDPEDPIKRSNLPEMLQFLLELSQQPTNTTHYYAQDMLDQVNAPPPTPKDFWKTVLEEEPFEGEHWQDPWADEDDDAKSLSSHPSMELESRESSSITESTSEHGEEESENQDEAEDLGFGLAGYDQHTLNDAHDLYETLCADQYWRPQYVNDAARRVGKEFNVNDPATLGPSFERALEKEANSLLPAVREVYVDEIDVVRDVLITMQGRSSLIFTFHYDGSLFRRVEPAASLPRVSHLTITAYRSLLTAFGTTATTLHHLRVFVTSVLRKSMNAPRAAFTLHQPDTSMANVSQQNSLVLSRVSGSAGSHSCRALDAFAEAVSVRLRALDEFCAGLEEKMCNARLGTGSQSDTEPVVVSLLSLRRRLDDFMARTFDILYDLIRGLPDELPSQTYAHPRSYYSTSSTSTVTILSPLPLHAIQTLHPALLNKRLLDRLLIAVRACNRDGGHGGDARLASDQTLHAMDGGNANLMGVFIATAEPVWTAVGAWVKWGIDVGGNPLDIGLGGSDELFQTNDLSHDREFFVKRREAVDVASPDFWTTGYVLRTSNSEEDSDDEGALDAEMSYVITRKAQGLPYAGLGLDAQEQPKTMVPNCLIPIASQVLAAGKAVGLLRAIGVWGAIGGEYDSQDEEAQEGEEEDHDNDDDWPSFSETLKPVEGAGILDTSLELGSMENLGRYNLDDTILPESSFSVNQSSSPVDPSNTDRYPLAPNLASEVLLNDLPHILADRVAPRCQIAAYRLNRVLVEDCELWRHLHAMEDLCFMRRGDVMTHFCDVLFAKIEAQKPWTDYHLLNSLFRDVISATSPSWIDLGRVRLIYRGTKARSSARSIRAVHGLEIEYEFPFPLPYMFGTNALYLYSQVFVLVLQLRRAKMVLDRILVRDVGTYRPELKMIYVLRGQLMWFVNTYMNFVLINVIHTQVIRFHNELAEAKALDEMILKHKIHIERVQEQCFLRPKDASIHKTVLSILDMCVQFGDLFASAVADTTLDLSRPIIAKGRRNKRDRSIRENVVSFIPPPESDNMSTTSAESLESDADDEDDEKEVTELETTSMDPTFLGAGDDWAARVERLSQGLESLVRSLRKRVEAVVGEGGPSAPAFGMLDFALEGWDL